MKVFVYEWHVEDEEEENETSLKIRAYGVTEHGTTVCFHIQQFNPWFFIEFSNPTIHDWTPFKTYAKNKICDLFKEKSMIKPFLLSSKRKLYYHDGKAYPFMKVRFNSMEGRRRCMYRLQNKKISIMGKPFEILCHEYEASPLLQMICQQNLMTCGWFEFEGRKCTERRKKTVLEHEFTSNLHEVHALHDHHVVPPMTFMSFDLEVYSSNKNKMPDASIPEDVIFQISYVLKTAQNEYIQVLHTLGSVPSSKFEVVCFASEKDLLMGFQQMIQAYQPNVIMGYNIFGFDIPYLVSRARFHHITEDWQILGFTADAFSPYKEIRWSSSAYSYQEFHYIRMEGRLVIDLLPVIRRDYKFSNYRLKTVSTHFLGETKDPLTPQDIFEAYEQGVLQRTNIRKLVSCGKYCVKDAFLVLNLFEKLQMWVGLTEMAKICNVPIMSLFVQGQQIKVFSQIYKKCHHDQILVQSAKSLKTPIQDHYMGAFVFPPTPGLYDWVIPFDFSSLYPTSIIAYNIDYSTLVLNDSIPDNKCHVIEWTEEDGKRYKFRFIKEPIGVIPELLQTLLKQRAETKKSMKHADSDLAIVLDKRQLAYKISANSMYGAMGVQKGYLPFMPGAMATTAIGRLSIQKAAEYVQSNHKGKLIYGDSVTYNTLLYIKNNQELEIVKIGELFARSTPMDYPQFRMEDKTLLHKQQCLTKGEVLTRSGWSPIQRLIRHETSKTIYSVLTTSGLVEVTEDHSLLTHEGKCIRPKDLVEGTLLLNVDWDRYGMSIKALDYPFDTWEAMWRREDDYIYFYFFNDIVFIGYVYWKLKQSYPDLVFMEHESSSWCIDLLNRKHLPQGMVLKVISISATNDVYDVETLDGSFHCGLGTLIVKNTDSIYCHFEKKSNAKELWDYAKQIESEFCRLFPNPMKLVFEEKIYQRFLILTKKRYMALTCEKDGMLEKNLTIRGVLLARRDNCRWIRKIYEECVRLLMQRSSKAEILDRIHKSVLEFFHLLAPCSEFITSKLVGKDYKIRALPMDVVKAKKRLNELQVSFPSDISLQDIEKCNKQMGEDEWIRQYYDRSKPAHVQLALKMCRRGVPVSAGMRIEFLVIEHQNDPKTKLHDKLEDPIYFMKHRDVLRIDRFYYIQSLCKPVDQILQVVYQQSGMCSSILKVFFQHHLVIQDLNKRFQTQINFFPPL